jgi:hypothetical protein
MAAPVKIQFATNSYRSASLPVSAQTCMNAYAALQPKDAKTDVAVFGPPGIVNFATCGNGPIRGLHTMADVAYAVSGPSLYRINSDGSATSVGGAISGAGRVSMDDNGTQLAIVNGELGFIYAEATGFQVIVDADFHAADTVALINAVFAFNRSGTNEFFVSDNLDGLSYSDIFASAEWRSDNIKAVANHIESLYLLGTSTIEGWYSTGDPNFPFRRYDGSAIDRGVASSDAFVSDSQELFVIGNDRVGHKVTQGGIVPFTTEAINQEWRRYARVDDAFMFSYGHDGHRFIVATFPTANKTFAYDRTSGLLHERSSRDMYGNDLGRWRVNSATEAYGKTLVGDAFSGMVGYHDSTVFTEFGNTIVTELVSPPIHADGRIVFMPWFELDVETGVGLTSGQGSDPQIMLSLSDDGGRTWTDQEMWRSMGKIGKYKTRLRWDRLGSFTNRHIKVTISDPVRRTIIAARCPELTVAA